MKTQTLVMNTQYKGLLRLLGLLGVIFSVFVLRTILADRGQTPVLNDWFTVLIVVSSVAVAGANIQKLRPIDWIAALGAGLVVGVSMVYATLFSPFPFLGIAISNPEQAMVRGACTGIAMLGGLAVMRLGGPVQSSAILGNWRKTAASLGLGLLIGAPLAALNVFALQFSQGHGIDWQNPVAALFDALQPALVEEVIYRFALLGLVWLALLVHNFMHLDDLFLQAPLMALGMGTAMALFWGLPPTILALRRDLESAVAFHWFQDAARFLAGF